MLTQETPLLTRLVALREGKTIIAASSTSDYVVAPRDIRPRVAALLAECEARIEALAEFDPETVRVCAETLTDCQRWPESIRMARHNFLQRLATALAKLAAGKAG